MSGELRPSATVRRVFCCLRPCEVCSRQRPSFGRHRYELYLSHEFIIIAGVALYARFYPHEHSRPVTAAFVIVMLFTTAPLAWALARFFTEPANRWLRGVPLPAESSLALNETLAPTQPLSS